MRDMVTSYASWPGWLKSIVMGPNVALLLMLSIWWPKNDQGWTKFSIVGGYLVVFYLIMHYVFRF